MAELIKALSITPMGLIPAIEEAGHYISQTPDGWLVSDVAAVQAIIDTYEGSSAQLDYTKTQKLTALGALVLGKFDAGRNSGGKTWQIDEVSQGRISAIGALAGFATAGAVPWPADGYPWIAADNDQVKFTATQMFAFAQDIAAYVAGLVLTNRAFKNAISAAPDVATLGQIDIMAGWPAN